MCLSKRLLALSENGMELVPGAAVVTLPAQDRALPAAAIHFLYMFLLFDGQLLNTCDPYLTEQKVRAVW
jgi:hypothetical protein